MERLWTRYEREKVRDSERRESQISHYKEIEDNGGNSSHVHGEEKLQSSNYKNSTRGDCRIVDGDHNCIIGGQAWAIEKQNQKGQTLNMFIQTEPQILEEIPENIQIGNEKLMAFAEERELRGFNSGKLWYVRVECNPLREETESINQGKEEVWINERRNCIHPHPQLKAPEKK